MPVAGPQRGYAGARYLLEFGGATAGDLYWVQGGDALCDVVVEKVGPAAPWRNKHIAGVRWSDLVLTTGIGMSRSFYDAVEDLPNGTATRYDGAVVVADFNYSVVERREFKQALLTGVGFPALDAASKEAAHLTVTFSPERVERGKGSGKAPGGSVGSKQKQWVASRFRVTMPGLDCSRVSRVSAVTITSQVVASAVGELRDYATEPAWLELSDLVLTVDASHAETFRQWHEDFVIKGNNGQDKEKTATIEYLSATGTDVLATVELSGVGIYKLADEDAAAGSESIRRVVASMYCERASLRFGTGAASSAAPTNGGVAGTTESVPVVLNPSLVDTAVLADLHVRRTA
jgi:hypothetical protein